MSDTILDKGFIKKKEKAISILIKANDYKDSVVIGFMKLVKMDYLNDMEIIIGKGGIEKHIKTISEFKQKFTQEEIEMEDITAFQRLDEIYHEDICNYQRGK